MTPASLKRRADALRLTNSELARLAGVDEDNLGKIFNGRVDPRLSSLAKIDAALSETEAEMKARLAVVACDVPPASTAATMEEVADHG
jgi:predicted transcriptional regulator